jgi:polyferredoxin/formate hydrogenlyase subunit 6/NADH:ubiquinone oxidoreductase subunit I
MDVIRRLRIASQTIFLIAFLYLLTRTQYAGVDEIRLPVKILLEIDPLEFLSTFLSRGTVPGLLWLALITIALSFVFGRFFCGWVCPMGTLIQLAEKLPVRRRKSVIETNRWHRAHTTKFYLLSALLVSAVLGLQWTGVLDPLTIAIRSVGLVVFPALELGLRPLFEAAYQHNPLGITKWTEPLYEALQGSLMSFNQPHFLQSFFLGTIFLGILALSFLRYRFWCRILCPLGALLGVFARFGFFRIRQGSACSQCQRCTFDCQGAADPARQGGWRPSECVVCGNCTAACQDGELAMGFGRPRWRAGGPAAEGDRPKTEAKPGTKPETEPEFLPALLAGTQVQRRHVLLAGLGGIAAAPMMKLGERSVRANPALIRPPGAVAEAEFLDLCIRCGECMKVCLTNGLQPTLLEAGLAGLWSPRLYPRIGYCEYACTLCGQVCPTGAIRRLTPAEKKKVRIGLASFDTSRCLPYAYQKTCIVCEEHCPTSPKAIWFQEVEVATQGGGRQRVKQPRVSIDLCIGCGICESKCPVQDLPAIRVTSANEDRNLNNRVLLGGPGGDPYGAGGGADSLGGTR